MLRFCITAAKLIWAIKKTTGLDAEGGLFSLRPKNMSDWGRDIGLTSDFTLRTEESRLVCAL